MKSATLLARELVIARAINRYGHLLDKGVLYRLLNNRVYIGEAVHKGVSYPGEHEAIIDRKLWDQAHAILTESPRKRAAAARAQTPALLRGLLFGPDGAAMSPTHTRKRGRLYRYYISQTAMKRGREACGVRQVPAAEIERVVIDQIRALLQTPEIIVQTWRSARKTDNDLAENDVRAALLEFEPLWNKLFPAEQARIVELLVERVDLQADGIDLRLRVEGLTSLCNELRGALASTRRQHDRHSNGASWSIRSPRPEQGWAHHHGARHQGGRKQVVTPAGATPSIPPRSRVDNTLVKAIVRAHRWRDMLESGDYATVRDLAKAENINESYLGRVLRLTLLAPKIVEAILEGKQPASLDLEWLLKKFPVEWSEQLEVMSALAPKADIRQRFLKSVLCRYCCKSLFGVTNENFKSR